MRHNFKIGDKVFDYRHGWMVVEALSEQEDHKVEVITEKRCKDRHKTYFYYYEETLKTLSFTEYTLDGYSNERPVQEFEIGSRGYFWDDLQFNSCLYSVLEKINDNDNDYKFKSTKNGSYNHFSLTPPRLNQENE